MFQFGQFNKLIISRLTPQGFYLVQKDGTDKEEVLLPKKYITEEMKEGNEITVFIYKDSDDRPVATTQTPTLKAGEAGYLLVKEVTRIGAFLDWGLEKDLLLPFREQAQKVEAGRHYLVYVYVDQATQRMSSTTNLNKFIKNRDVQLKTNQEVDLLITYTNETGIRVIINQQHWGMLYQNEIFKPLQKGTIVKGFIKKVREDGKIDVALQKQGIAAAKDVRDILLQKIQEQKDGLALSDVSPPELIYQVLSISKKNFKKAVGMLMKEDKIEVKENRLYLKRKKR